MLTTSQVHYDFSFLLFPVLSDSNALVIFAYIINNFTGKTSGCSIGLRFFNSKVHK
ncbi:HPP family protein [Gilliamella sp. App2-1]|uniref:HPP family protein n=1 Tax=Gilliamella sp. App2-1 TaxID=3120230 RepID=UPI003FA59B8F